MAFEGYAIVPPIRPWDEKHREEIEMDLARRTIGATPGEAWSKHCRRGADNIDHQEFGQRVQYWHGQGYRLKRVRVEFLPDQDNALETVNSTKKHLGD